MRFSRLLIGLLLATAGCSDMVGASREGTLDRWVLVKYDARTLLGPSFTGVPPNFFYADTLYLNMEKNFAIHVITSASANGAHERHEILREILRFNADVGDYVGFSIDFYCAFNAVCPAIGGPSVARMRADTLQFLNSGVGVVREYLQR